MDISIAYWQIEDALESREEDAVLKTLEEKFNITIVSQNIARYMDSPETEGCMTSTEMSVMRSWSGYWRSTIIGSPGKEIC